MVLHAHAFVDVALSESRLVQASARAAALETIDDRGVEAG
jgi:hypothetical protein